MKRRRFLMLFGGPHAVMLGAPALADGSRPQLTSYYERHVTPLGGVAYGCTGRACLVGSDATGWPVNDRSARQTAFEDSVRRKAVAAT